MTRVVSPFLILLLIVILLVPAGSIDAAEGRAALAVTAAGMNRLLERYCADSAELEVLRLELEEGTVSLLGVAAFPVSLPTPLGEIDLGRVPAAFRIRLRPAVPAGDRDENRILCEIVRVEAAVRVAGRVLQLPAGVVTGIVLPLLVEELREAPAVARGESTVDIDEQGRLVFVFKALELPTGLPMVVSDIAVSRTRIGLALVEAGLGSVSKVGGPDRRWQEE